jgi:xylulokinase
MAAPDQPLLLGIDAGTSRIRALLFTPEGQPVAVGSEPTPTTRTRPGWAEHDPEAIWTACCRAIRTALAAIERPERIVGMAIGSVGEALVALDDRGRPLSSVIAWYDERPRPQLERLLRTIGKDRLHRLTGLSPDPTFSLLKLLWLKDEAPDLLPRTRQWLNLTHYLAFRLTGVAGSDLTQASRTLALDLEQGVWAEALIQEVGIDPKIFPPLRPVGAALGPVTAEAARATGLPESCIVGVGGHDHIVGALAAGALEPDVMLNSLGTAEAVTVTLPAPTPDPALGRQGYSQGMVEVDGRRTPYVFGGFVTSGAAVEWFRALFEPAPAHDALIAEALTVPPGADGVTFLPDLRGRISPVPDPKARGAWFGLAADSSRSALYRALLEGLAFEARLSFDALTSLPGLPRLRAIHAIGGNTQNDLLLRIKASVYRQPIKAIDLPEATALGAALLGGLAAGLWPDLASARAGLALSFREIEPVAAWEALYERRYQEVYRPAYEALRPLHHALPD